MDNMFNLTGSIGGLQIIIAPEKRIQRKTHKKKRINKKWAKRYGYKHIKSMEDNNIYLIPGHNQIIMNRNTYNNLKNAKDIKDIENLINEIRGKIK